jgi:hypothetical protein
MYSTQKKWQTKTKQKNKKIQSKEKKTQEI